MNDPITISKKNGVTLVGTDTKQIARLAELNGLVTDSTLGLMKWLRFAGNAYELLSVEQDAAITIPPDNMPRALELVKLLLPWKLLVTYTSDHTELVTRAADILNPKIVLIKLVSVKTDS